MGVKVRGMRELLAAVKRSRAAIQSGVAAGVFGVGNEIMTDAKRRVPVDLGALKGSGYVTAPEVSDGTARVKKDRNEVGTTVALGEGAPLQGDAKAASITYNGQGCKA